MNKLDSPKMHRFLDVPRFSSRMSSSMGLQNLYQAHTTIQAFLSDAALASVEAATSPRVRSNGFRLQGIPKLRVIRVT